MNSDQLPDWVAPGAVKCTQTQNKMPLTPSRPPQRAFRRIPGALEEPIKLLKITHVISRGKSFITKIRILFQVAIIMAGP